jgi:hypothetical protein
MRRLVVLDKKKKKGFPSGEVNGDAGCLGVVRFQSVRRLRVGK